MGKLRTIVSSVNRHVSLISVAFGALAGIGLSKGVAYIDHINQELLLSRGIGLSAQEMVLNLEAFSEKISIEDVHFSPAGVRPKKVTQEDVPLFSADLENGIEALLALGPTEKWLILEDKKGHVLKIHDTADDFSIYYSDLITPYISEIYEYRKLNKTNSVYCLKGVKDIEKGMSISLETAREPTEGFPERLHLVLLYFASEAVKGNVAPKSLMIDASRPQNWKRPASIESCTKI